jgi:hypothetical protein
MGVSEIKRTSEKLNELPICSTDSTGIISCKFSDLGVDVLNEIVKNAAKFASNIAAIQERGLVFDDVSSKRVIVGVDKDSRLTNVDFCWSRTGKE